MATTTSEATEGVLRRIRALLALASNNPNENEAAAASAKAIEMMERFNIDLSSLSAQEGDQPGKRAQQQRKGGLYGWQRDLWKACAELNFCMYWSIKGLAKGSTYEHKLLGRHANVVSTEVLAEYLQTTIERLTQTYAKANSYNVFAREMIAYREGMAQRLVNRLREKREEVLAAEREREREEEKRRQHPGYSSTGTGLALATALNTEADYNNDFLMGWEPGTSARKRAEEKARQFAREQEWKAELAREKAWREANPEEAKAKDDKAAADYAAWIGSIKVRKTRPRAEPKYRERAMTAAEKRAGLSEYREGYRKGDTIGLDKQVDKTSRDRLK